MPSEELDHIKDIGDSLINEFLMENRVGSGEILFEDDKVDIIEFAESKEFCGLKLFPRIRDLIWLIEDDTVREANLILGKGSGKTTILGLFHNYGFYLLDKMIDPYNQEGFNVLPGVAIALVSLSITGENAKKVAFDDIKVFMKRNPYFNDRYFTRENEVQYNKKNFVIHCGHSNSEAWLGFNTIRGSIDETDKMKITRNRNVAENLDNSLKGSLTTRFPDHYKIVRVTSAETEQGYLSQLHSMIGKVGTDIELEDVDVVRSKDD